MLDLPICWLPDRPTHVSTLNLTARPGTPLKGSLPSPSPSESLTHPTHTNTNDFSSLVLVHLLKVVIAIAIRTTLEHEAVLKLLLPYLPPLPLVLTTAMVKPTTVPLAQ